MKLIAKAVRSTRFKEMEQRMIIDQRHPNDNETGDVA